MPPQLEEQTKEEASEVEASEWEKPIQDIEEEDHNMLIRIEWDRLQEEFFEYLQSQTTTITTIVARHLRLAVYQPCRVADRSEWLSGTFNVCIPVYISNWRARRVLIRCPFPHRIGGTLMDEKIRCEAGSFIHLSQDCPRVPIPHLFGFGVPSGLHFSLLEYAPWSQRALSSLRHWWAWIFRRPYLRPFFPYQSHVSLKSGYLLMEFFEKERGQMLSKVLGKAGYPSREHRRTLFRSLRRIILDLSRPLSKIGSFTVHDSGEVSLTNRPLTKGLAILENEGVPTEIPRDYCYLSTDSYLLDLLNCHDQRLIHQPNAARSKLDLEGQIATTVTLRALQACFSNKPSQQEPPNFQFTDLHESNVIVNDRYHITGIVDVEWSCSLPREMQHPPFWVSGHELDDLYGEGTRENEEKFESACEEFLQILAEEDEGETFSIRPRDYAQAMRDSLRRKQHWYFTAVKIPSIAYNLFIHKIQPHFAFAHSEEDAGVFQDVVARYWRVDILEFFEQKRRDWSNYLRQLRSMQGSSISTPV